jgi:hypothetical protein
MPPNDPKLSHSRGKISRDSRQPKNMNLQIIIRKTEGVVAVGCSALLGVIFQNLHI